MDKRVYNSPNLEELGTVADLTQVGQTNPGEDSQPGQGRDNGSIYPSGLDDK